MPAGLPIGFPPPTEHGIIELKFYPEYRAVTYPHTGQPQYATQAAFDPLYRHISSNQIAMTTPVEARYFEESTIVEVSFLYPNSNINPQTINPNVKVTDYPSMKVISAGIQGAYSWENYQIHLQKLQNWLTEHPEYEIAGPARRLLYNSPMTPESIKSSEVQIPVRLVE